MQDIKKQILDLKCRVLKDYLDDLEEVLKKKVKDFSVVQVLEDQSQEAPVDLSDAVIKGVHDWLYRNPIGYLESEITKTKYEYSIALAELFGIDKPESKYDIEKIKGFPIFDLIGQFTIIRNGNAICPIHRERTASLHIYEDTNSWFCFGCNKGGSVIDFMMELNQYSLNEALDDLSKLI